MFGSRKQNVYADKKINKMGKNIYHDRVVRSDETAIVCVNGGQLVIAILMLKLDANEYFVFKKI